MTDTAAQFQSSEVRMPVHYLETRTLPESFDESNRTVEVIFATERSVKRNCWRDGPFMEVLSLDPAHVRTERLEKGASFLDAHDSWSMKYRLGTVVPGTIKFENGRGICTIKLSRKVEAEDLFQDLKDGHPLPVSVGYRVHAYEQSEKDGEIPTRTAIDWEPFEVSAAPIPADPGAHARSETSDLNNCVVKTRVKQEEAPMAGKNNNTGKSARSDDAVTDDAAPVDNETTETEPTDGVEETAGGQTEEEQAVSGRTTREPTTTTQRPSGPVESPQAAAREAVAHERQRVAEIRTLCRSFPDLTDDFVNGHIDGGSTIQEVRDAILNDMVERQEAAPTHSAGAAIITQDSVDVRRAAVANALLHRINPDRTQLTDAGREWRGLSLLETARDTLRESGVNTRGMSPDQVATRALHTTSDFPIILNDVVNQTLIGGYQEEENTFQLVAKRATFNDFRKQYRVRLGVNAELEKVNEHGEFRRGSFVESKEGFSIATYGKIMGLTRQAIINDALNAFGSLPDEMGREIARLEGDVVWGIIISNIAMANGTALFHADHGNLAGAGAAPSVATLKAARAAFRKLKDLNGTRINLPPKYLFVGTDLEVDVEQLLVSTTVPTQTADVVPQSLRSLIPVSEYRLDDLGAAWFLFADPSRLPAGLEYAYLNGQEQPFTEQRVGFEVDGVEWKIRHDFGAGATDTRFGYKNPGA